MLESLYIHTCTFNTFHMWPYGLVQSRNGSEVMKKTKKDDKYKSNSSVFVFKLTALRE